MSGVFDVEKHNAAIALARLFMWAEVSATEELGDPDLADTLRSCVDRLTDRFGISKDELYSDVTVDGL